MVQPSQKKVLLVDDEEVILEALQKFLEKNHYQVKCVSNGKIARDLMGIEAFDLVISDIHMPGSQISGVELLAYVKSTKPDVPVILMTGFATISETKDAYANGAAAFLAKPFDRDELLKTVQKLLHIDSAQASSQGEEDLSEHYSKLSIDDFISGRQIQYNIYVRLSKSKFIKVAHQGEDLEIDRVKHYKEKGIRHLYLSKEDFNSYMKFNIGLSQAIRLSPAISAQKKMNFLKHTGELILEHVYHGEISQENFNDARNTVDTTLSFLAESEASFNLIESLNQHSDYLYAHSLGVSLYSVMIGKQLEWNSPQTIYKLSMGGLLHDIGKKEIDEKIIRKERNSMSSDVVKIYETHPSRGMEILSRVPTIPSDILQIVLQHHERDTGTGYPNHLMKSKIHPLARVVAVANEFCKLIIKGPSGSAVLPPRTAVERLEMLYGQSIDPLGIVALRKVISGQAQ